MSTLKQDIEALVEVLEQSLDKDLLKRFDDGEIEYWDSGNYDDCFSAGVKVGEQMNMLTEIQELRRILATEENRLKIPDDTAEQAQTLKTGV